MKITHLLVAAASCTLFGQVALAQSAEISSKPASPATIRAQQEAEATLPADDGTDAAFADQGFIATRTDPLIRNGDGETIWDLDAYKWMGDKPPATVNPSLWRHQKLLRKHGLYKLADGMWQVRGFDLSNMTIIQGSTGWILIDPLTNRETAKAALELVNQHLGTRPVTGILYTHSHADHFGGVRGVVEEEDIAAGKTAIIAPEHFVRETASENVIAGSAMARRANYQFGGSLKPGPAGQLGNGIGSAG